MMNRPQDRTAGPIAAAAGLAIALLLAWAPDLSAYDGKTGWKYNGEIQLTFTGDSMMFSVGSRCYDKDGDGLGEWEDDARFCTKNSYGRWPRYIKIQKKNFWGEDTGSAWRKWRDCDTANVFCVKVSGSNVGSATATAQGCESIAADCPGFDD